jgi:hypothetical protein
MLGNQGRFAAQTALFGCPGMWRASRHKPAQNGTSATVP